MADSLSYSEVLRRLGMRAAGGNHATLHKYATYSRGNAVRKWIRWYERDAEAA